MSGEPAPELVDALREAQRLGFLGARPIPDVIDHARGFVRALAHVGPVDSVLDLGSGGGVPGLVIAHDLPNVRVTLLDRIAKRTDVLERVVGRLGWQGRVEVRCQDVDTFDPDDRFDAVVARGFGPPDFTLTHASRLVHRTGAIVISEPPATNRWDPALISALELHRVPWPNSDRHEDLTAPSGADGGLDGLVAVFVRR